jgi:hypothetical protein
MHHKPIFISSALAGEWLGLEEVDDDVWCIYFFNTDSVAMTATTPIHRSLLQGKPGGFAPRTPRLKV